MSREYDQLAWVDYPETLTPISAANLNRMENGIANLYTDRNKMESNIAYVEEGETATRHYFINSYLMLNGIFYKTTSEINIGDILDPTLAGNIEHVDVSSQFGSGGGGSTGCVELTQAQYDALSEEAKMLDVIYLITDSPDNYLDEVFGDFATVEYTDTASKAYAVGDYLVYDSKFYKVTSAIAQGDTIVPDTNVVKTTVADEFSNASNVAYDNTESGLEATDVQDALDEIATNVVEHTLTFNSGITVNGSARCFTYGKICFIALNDVVFASTGGSLSLITGVPKPVAQTNGSTPKSSTTSNTDLIKNNSCYIPAGATDIRFNIGSNNTVRHWMNMMYITQ